MNNYRNNPCYFELAAIIAVGALHVLIKLLGIPVRTEFYSGFVTGIFLCYLVWRVVYTQRVLYIWGMRSDNFWQAFKRQFAFGIPAAVFVCGYGIISGSSTFNNSIWIMLGLYPFWGIAQQFALQNFVAKNLRKIIPQPFKHAFIVSLLFCLSHFPCIPLMILTMIAGFFFTLIYRHNPNIWAVGIVHGILGALVYFFILRENTSMGILNFLNS